MIEILINISSFIAPIFYKIVYMSIVGSILGILILVLGKLLDSKLSAKWKCFMLLIPVLFLIIPISRIRVNVENDFALTSVINKVETSLNNIHTLNYNEPKIEDKTELIKTMEENITAKAEKSSIDTDIETINLEKVTFYTLIPIIWSTGLSISVVIFIIGSINLKYRINKSKKLNDSIIRLVLVRCKRKLRINKRIEIRIQNINASPCIYGIIKPKILVSEEFIRQ